MKEVVVEEEKPVHFGNPKNVKCKPLHCEMRSLKYLPMLIKNPWFQNKSRFAN